MAPKTNPEVKNLENAQWAQMGRFFSSLEESQTENEMNFEALAKQGKFSSSPNLRHFPPTNSFYGSSICAYSPSHIIFLHHHWCGHVQSGPHMYWSAAFVSCASGRGLHGDGPEAGVSQKRKKQLCHTRNSGYTTPVWPLRGFGSVVVWIDQPPLPPRFRQAREVERLRGELRGQAAAAKALEEQLEEQRRLGTADGRLDHRRTARPGLAGNPGDPVGGWVVVVVGGGPLV